MNKKFILYLLIGLIIGCSKPSENSSALPGSLDDSQDGFLNIAGARIGLASQPEIDWDFQAVDPYMDVNSKISSSRVPLFGDLHVHTKYSFDAYIFGTLASPDDAYEFAKGAPLRHPAGFDMQLKRPLDFYGVTDHGTFLGQVEEAATPGTVYYEAPSSIQVRDINSVENLN